MKTENTLQEIKDQVAQEWGWDNWDRAYQDGSTTTVMVDEVARRYAAAVAENVLNNAAKRYKHINKMLNESDSEVILESILNTPIELI